jgi:hypothetical protein
MSTCKQIFSALSNNYGGRLYKMYVVNTPFALRMVYKIASTVLDEVTVNKINLESDANIPGIFKYCDKSQVE